MSFLKFLFLSLIIFCSSFLNPAFAKVIGSIDKVVLKKNKGYFIEGWACDTEKKGRLSLNLFMGSSATFIKKYKTSKSTSKKIGKLCNSHSNKNKFSIPLSNSFVAKYSGKVIYIRGLSLVGGKNYALKNSGVKKIPKKAKVVIGKVERTFKSKGSFYIEGWSCQRNVKSPLVLEVFAKGANTTKTYVGLYKSNKKANSTVKKKCQTNSYNHAFVIKMPLSKAKKFRGQSIYVYGLSKVKKQKDQLLSYSKKYSFPGKDSEFERHSFNPIINPRRIVSPLSKTNKIAGTADPCALWDPLTSKWRIFWSVWDVASEERGESATGILGAVSSDGENFVVNKKLSLSVNSSFESGSVETCDVVTTGDDSYYMYYSASTDTIGDPEKTFHKIGLAISKDGVSFKQLSDKKSKDGIKGLLFSAADIFDVEDVPGNFVTDPTVVVRNDGYHMWTLCVVQVPESKANGGVCYHTSKDGIKWKHHGITKGLNFQNVMPIQPTVFYNKKMSRYDMYFVNDLPSEEKKIHNYSTNLGLRVKGFYHATSKNGFDWKIANDRKRVFSEDNKFFYENSGLATGADAVLKGDIIHFFYPSFTTFGGSIFNDLLNWPLNKASKRNID